MEKTKIFKVIKIIDEYTIVINAGSDYVKENDKLEIYIPGSPIIDPDTKENLGTLDTIKAKLIVTNVYEKFCICTNARISKTISPLAQIALLSSSLQQEEPQKLDVDPEQISGGYNSEDLKIRIGDLVKKY